MKIENKKTSHKEILRATGILGSAQVAEILIKIGRNKIIAILLGPSGVGLIGLYQSIIDLMRSATGFGLNFSAVKNIAEAAGSGDKIKIIKTISIVRRWVLFTGLFGFILTVILSRFLSNFAFGSNYYTVNVAMLSIAVFINALTIGQLSLLQGLRRVSLMAKAKILGVFFGFFITIPIYVLFKREGIIPALVITSLISLSVSWYYSRTVQIDKLSLKVHETFRGGLSMIRLGFFMVITGFTQTIAMYLIRSYISNNSGLYGVGQFQASWNLSQIYFAMILQAMGTDYLPRLSAVNKNNYQVNKLVNEQTEIGILLAGPMVLIMLSFVDTVVNILYTGEFVLAIRILHWQLAGAFFQVVSWPMTFIIITKGLGLMTIASQIMLYILMLSPLFFLWHHFGLEITGMSFLFAYFIYTLLICIVAFLVTGFKWNAKVIKYIVFYTLLIVSNFFSTRYFYLGFRYVSGVVISAIAILFSYRQLRNFIDIKTLIRKVYKK